MFIPIFKHTHILTSTTLTTFNVNNFDSDRGKLELSKLQTEIYFTILDVDSMYFQNELRTLIQCLHFSFY